MTHPDTSLFIGQSPLQILNLVEASRTYGQRGPLFIVYDAEEIRTQIESLLQRLGVSDYRFQQRSLWFRLTYPVTLWLRFFRLRGKVDTIFFGTYTTWASYLVNLLHARHHVLVDDGQKTITIVTAPQAVGLGGRRSRSPFARDYVNDAELFTFYDTLAARHGRRATPNRLRSVAEQLMAGSAAGVPAVGPDDIIFIGTNVTRRYAPLECAMARVVEMAAGRRILYLKHRRDDPQKLAELADRFGFEVLSFDLPLELVFHRLWTEHRPAVWTFGTTATDTLQAMYGDLAICVFRLDQAGFTTRKLASAFETIYALYRANPRIELVDTAQPADAPRSQSASA